MSQITAILEPDADGTLHVPLPEDLRGGKVEITATLKAAVDPIAEAMTSQDLIYERGYRECPEDVGLTVALLPHLAIESETWE